MAPNGIPLHLIDGFATLLPQFTLPPNELCPHPILWNVLPTGEYPVQQTRVSPLPVTLTEYLTFHFLRPNTAVDELIK